MPDLAAQQLKGFLAGLDPGFRLYETMRVTRDCRVRHLDRHLERLGRSALALAFRFDREQVMAALEEALAGIVPGVMSRLRLELQRDGRTECRSEALLPLPDGRVDLLIESQPLAGPRPMAEHKTTLRADYDAGMRRAELRGAHDCLFFTADGRMVEGAHSNVFILLDGRWWTPPLSDGAFPGLMRAMLLEDPAWQAGERTLRLSDVHRARSLMVCSALHGAVPGRLVIDP